MQKIEELAKWLDAIEAENKATKEENVALKKRVEELEKQPAPPKGAKMDSPALTKQDDTKPDLEKGKKAEEKVEPIDMVRKAHSEPQIYALHKPLG